jgi:hypothetical protein
MVGDSWAGAAYKIVPDSVTANLVTSQGAAPANAP